MKSFNVIFALLVCSTFICSGQESIAETDSDKISQDSSSVSQHDIDKAKLKKVYAELLDIEKQIRLTHNMLVDLNYMNPGVERKVTQQLDGLNIRLDNASNQLDSVIDKELRMKIPVFFSVIHKYFLLVGNTVALTVKTVIV